MKWSIPILYEDNHILVAVKPPSLPTQPVEKNSSLDSAESLLKSFIKKRDMKPGNVFLHALFRLDLPVSGLVVFAKSMKALQRLQETQKDHKHVKEYGAIIQNVSNTPPQPQVLRDFLIKREFHAEIASSETFGSKKSETEILSSEPVSQLGLYKVRLRLHTGRYHQIRLQLSNRGWPILGDTKYHGIEMTFSGCHFSQYAIALHHMELFFHHPIQKNGINDLIQMTDRPIWY